TLNLHSGFSLYYGADMPGVAAEIRQNGVDVLLLQEVEGGRLTSYGVDQAAWLARELGMQLNYFATNEGLHGLAILSRLPIESVLTAPLSTQSRATGIQFVRIRAQDGETIDLYNTALTLIFRGGALSVEQQEEEQIRQMLEVFDFIKVNDSLERRSVLGGTFNHAPGGDIYIFLTQNDFIDPFKDYPTERAVTLRLVNEAPVRVDYLWLKGIDPQFVGVAPIIQSNHNLAIVEVKLQ
ncbi:MAG: endonuclease/exonuclease/phosphatase family protein, partial [Anaerolinea sp.]|nr:endonuclease/exonuclease/phosphatase family protein [Anaerolinea sp.]